MTTDQGMDIDPSYEEIVAERDEHERARTALEELVGQLDSEKKFLTEQRVEARADERQAMRYLEEVRQAARHGGDFPSLVREVAELRRQIAMMRGV